MVGEAAVATYRECRRSALAGDADGRRRLPVEGLGAGTVAQLGTARRVEELSGVLVVGRGGGSSQVDGVESFLGGRGVCWGEGLNADLLDWLQAGSKGGRGVGGLECGWQALSPLLTVCQLKESVLQREE